MSTGPDYLQAVANLIAAFGMQQLIPLIAWCVMFGVLLWFLVRAQRRDDFDATELLRNDDGKLELGRILGASCFITHTWLVMVRTLNDKITTEEQVLYGMLWSGVPIATQVIELWRGRFAAQQQEPKA
jgi:hypothetical protein